MEPFFPHQEYALGADHSQLYGDGVQRDPGEEFLPEQCAGCAGRGGADRRGKRA